MLKPFTKALLTAAITACAAASSMANLVTNGDFEAGAAGWSGPMGVYDTSIFTLSTGFAHSGIWAAVTGCISVSCVNTLGAGDFFGQTIATVIGGSYDLSFWVGEDGGPDSEFTVFWNGLLVADVLNPANNTLPTPSRPGYVQYTFTGLGATGAATAFEIHGRQAPAGIYFDDVAVELSAAHVPEPGSLALLGIALAGLAATARRAKRV
jgi:hypothetical protein